MNWPKLLFQSGAKCEAIHMKIIFLFNLMQINLIFTIKVLQLATF